MKKVQEADLNNKKVLLRVDFNVAIEGISSRYPVYPVEDRPQLYPVEDRPRLKKYFMKKVQEADLNNKKVLLRVDFNVAIISSRGPSSTISSRGPSSTEK